MAHAANLGFPRIGAKRELKKATEYYWKNEISRAELERVGLELRRRHWGHQRQAGLGIIPSNDFSFYDQVLDMTATLGAVPERFGPVEGDVDLDTYFDMARGTPEAPAMEMTKWFDTNYHYIVPEFTKGQRFRLASSKALDEFKEARKMGLTTRPVLLGPVSWLSLGKGKAPSLDPLDLLEEVLPVYAELLGKLKDAGAEWVQIDEPVLVLDLSDRQKDAFKTAMQTLSAAGPKLMLATYFGGLGDNLSLATSLPVDGLHIDLVRAPEQLDDVLARIADRHLSLGLVDGRNVWRADLDSCLDLAERAVKAIGTDRVEIAPSCSLLHVPVDLDQEKTLDDELRSWLAFARQKLDEVAVLATALNEGREAVADTFDASVKANKARKASPRIHNPAVAERLSKVGPSDLTRQSPYAERRVKQAKIFELPTFPTTTIGSFPQTRDVRKARAANRRGDMDDQSYEAFLKAQTKDCIAYQEEAGLDVLVHGEFERNDMVEYFGEQLDGFAFTKQGWVQSYGSRCVKPPIIFGDVSRPGPMTVDWLRYAQSLTDKPVKGMLTGPVTILNWSFVRNDQPRSETCRQIALAIRDEVQDLEAAGIGMIQIDEAALREGLPLRRADWEAYLDWAVGAFRLAASGVRDETQIHTHMCYSEFNDIMKAIAAMDADVISIETSRSDMELLDAFAAYEYPNEIGPGVWDIHSPRVPDADAMEDLLRKASRVVPAERLWVNPDCGLKTRGWPEVKSSIAHLVAAAQAMRSAVPAE
ncbi:5-methyltetrahydropteroyltriglutamate--homocysteine S-methyltransferase [Henriciella aquimarina]|uniref:5-methyltetrahydropteroyltriglutamate-- homocysteine S-methyltransferase n=1 Tax=Henriciella aquimarina TaxID=545261 RepID=UPI000A07566A|nr:5-methyltetrahydropteroyltriglutamate--homocysteine S-methyltransferase [Henriciella aquimarina]